MTIKADNRRVIQLSALPGVDIVIRRVSTKQVGLSAGVSFIGKMGLVNVAAEHAKEGSELLQSVSDTPARPESQTKYDPSDPFDPMLRQQIMIEAEREIVRKGLVKPTFAELCEAYDASVDEPELEMGPDFDFLVQEIMLFSGEMTASAMPGTRGSPADQETFPEESRSTNRPDKRKIRKAAS